MVDDAPPLDTELQEEDDESRTYRQYPTTPLHNDTIPKPLPLTEICIFSILLAIIVAHLWTVWSMRADVNIMMVRQKETQQQISHITKLVETMHTVRWRIVSEN